MTRSNVEHVTDFYGDHARTDFTGTFRNFETHELPVCKSCLTRSALAPLLFSQAGIVGVLMFIGGLAAFFTNDDKRLIMAAVTVAGALCFSWVLRKVLREVGNIKRGELSEKFSWEQAFVIAPREGSGREVLSYELYQSLKS